MSESKILLIDFSDIYKGFRSYCESLFGADSVSFMDLSDITGTNCYADDAAIENIRKLVEPAKNIPVRFFDSGNYHYISYILSDMVDQDFSLLLLDNHPDMQQSAFGKILSCGSWVRQALEDNPHLKNVYMWGVSPEHIREAAPLPDNVNILSPENYTDMLSALKLPLYISVDKDVLDSKFAACDWDQGGASPDDIRELFMMIGSSDIPVIAVDICGEKKSGPSYEELDKNLRTNKELLNIISAYLKMLPSFEG